MRAPEDGKTVDNKVFSTGFQSLEVTMEYKSDIQIAQECEMRKITEVAKTAGIERKYLEQVIC